MFKVKNNIYSVGVLNPNLRIFDIVMCTEFGTTYNSYLIKDPKGNVLIDTAHRTFNKEFFDHVKEVCRTNEIKYLIVNHCEPDHSGSIRDLIQTNPNIEIYCSQASKKFLEGITNLNNLKIHVVKDKETLKLAKHTLQFEIAPFLHWPDSMFTYVVEEKVVFTCDFLGSHYCEPQMIDSKITYPDSYFKALKYYYDAIFGPFKPWVKAGLKKLKALDIEYACTSHGPILTKKGLYPKILDLYEEWSEPNAKSNIVPIFYVSAYGCTTKIAESIAKGIKQAGYTPKLYDVIYHSAEELSAALNTCDMFCVGSPTLNRNALPPIWILLAGIDAINMRKKKAFVFGSYGWSGEAVDLISSYLNKLEIATPAMMKVNFVPTEKDLEAATKLAVEFAK